MIDFFLVGAPKAGTTSIYKYLCQSPYIFAPEVKEPNHYTDVGPNKRNVANVKDSDKYLKLYAKASDNQLKGDFSVSYMHDANAFKKIKADNPDAKIIMIVRHPVQRAYSHWLMDMREGFVKKSFIEEFSDDVSYAGKRGFCYNSMYLDCSLYNDSIERYRAEFADVLVLVYEEIFIDLEKTLKTISEFLNIPPVEALTSERFNESGEVKNPFFKFLYSSTFLRRILKVLFPENLKGLVRRKIIKKTESKISPEDFKKVVGYFKEDAAKVRKALNKPDLWPDIP